MGLVVLAGIGYLAVQVESTQSNQSSQSTFSLDTSSNTTALGSVLGAYIITTLTNGSVRTITDSVTSTATGASPCLIAGPPNGVYVRILSDGSGKPVVGANVSAFQKEGGPICNDVQYLEGPFTQTFTTDGNQWHALGMGNFGDLSVTVKYLGASYNFSAKMMPLSVTCDTLYVPSGKNIATTEFQTNCP